MTDAVAKLARLAWRLEWLSPDAGRVDFEPRTAALQSVLPYIDHLGDGSSIVVVSNRLLNVAREKRP
jgi:uncharacterized protein with von Willebrand factor type A (vWA) domain